MNEYTELFFKTDKPLNVKELSSFFTQLEGLYSFLTNHPEILEKVEVDLFSQTGLKNERLEDEIQKAFIESKYSDRDLNMYYSLRRKGSDLEIVYLSKKSPLLIIFGTAVVALTAAIILSGGKAEIELMGGKIKFKLPALADGLMKLEDFKQKVRFNRAERSILPEVKIHKMIANTKKDLSSEIQLLKKAREVEDMNLETIQKLNDEIKKREDELNNLNS